MSISEMVGAALCGLWLLTFVAVLVGLVTARPGYEDGAGFHRGKPGK